MKKICLPMLIVSLIIFISCSQRQNEWREVPIDLSQDEMANTRGAEMPKQMHAEHILVKTSEEANSILFDLNRGGNFEDIARARSICPSGKKGGDLGWFGRGMMVKEFEDAAFATPPGKISGIVKTQFGYHIIKVLEVK